MIKSRSGGIEFQMRGEAELGLETFHFQLGNGKPWPGEWKIEASISKNEAWICENEAWKYQFQAWKWENQD